jgi:hypothetical protein
MIAAEQVVDGIIRLIQKNVVARTPFIADVMAGSQDIMVDDTLRFDGANEILLMDNSGGAMEYHTVLTKTDTNHIVLLNPVGRDFRVSDAAVIQKAIGNIPLFENGVLFGDREVIPNTGVVVTVEPVSLNNEWLYVQGGLSENHSISIMCYVKSDAHENALRVVMKYGDCIYRLLNENIHLDVVNDTTPLISDLSPLGDRVFIPDTTAWQADGQARYEVQDNNSAEIDFSIVEVMGPTELRLNRIRYNSYRVADKAKFLRRVAYMYDSRTTDVEWGTVSKNNTLFKAAKLTWFGKNIDEHGFPQVSKS